ncbi:helix-turn-helix transcriptional regulator [Arthrobacter sp. CAN_C5]|uniref:ArsR/SmtB family transcription factor n=1 Tax=Arthrobacter sp. CAN_C5 TaxID=2760706 RepID=UPI001AE45808|nr:metalloregulator ArsR/SmtB family transcription factor [Arthrobacter sp. CAN_C5]MBP2217031.1 ArsR family transcriptional regulator [Arthrobacter sp. CAN_C5]
MTTIPQSGPADLAANEATGPAQNGELEEARCCVASGSPALTPGRAEELAKQFKAIADPHRLRLVSLISSSTAHEACVCDLTEPLDLGQPTVSHHLKILVDAGILRREKRGVWAYYSVVPGALDFLAGVLTETR